MRAWILGVSCACILGGILVAGLWPFHSPKNDVAWVGSENGLQFGEYGAILGSSPFTMTGPPDETSCTLELWLQPRVVDDTSTLLTFYTAQNPVQVSMHQDHADLALSWNDPQTRAAKVVIDDVFPLNKPVFITVVSDTKLAVYINGVLVRTLSQLHISRKNLTGQLVVGNSAVQDDSWAGQLRGLAIYNRAITAAQAWKHYDTWTKKGRPEVAQAERTVALYLFDEHAGNVVHNQIKPGADLYIPERYVVLHHMPLDRVWNEFRQSWGYWKDVLINIGGFVPLGFFFCAYLSLVLQIRRAALATTIVGGLVSLAIEILQVYLPTRDSSMTDVMANTLGTGVGVILYRLKTTQALLRLVNCYGEGTVAGALFE
jgi:hypothetical protein